MKRFKRTAAGIVTALSLLLFLANAALWVRSYSRADVVMHLRTLPAIPQTGRRILALATIRGRYQIGLTWESHSSFSLIPDGWRRASMATALVNAPPASWITLGFGYAHVEVPAPFVVTQNGVPIESAATRPLVEAWNIWVPCWFVALLTVVDPVLWIRNAVKKSKE